MHLSLYGSHMVQPVMAMGRFVKLLVLLPALTAKCDDSLATRSQPTVIMRRADMQVLHVYSPPSVMSSYSRTDCSPGRASRPNMTR